MVDRSRELAGVMITNITTISSKFNRSICTQYDSIVNRITAHAECTTDLVQLQDYVDRLRVEELLQLRVSH